MLENVEKSLLEWDFTSLTRGSRGQQTGHAAARFFVLRCRARVSRLLSLVFGEEPACGG
jgi:hypothetical protein